ncbi:unnamed protein product [Phaedon cochleariae]|uniref:acid phosphatase n=1 Tax=Phaedon cochleariae TaxID=80249 RepID=A0A9P0E0N6_PHACE|nr:unnamed protein product [Phaedon cochleariae]
MCAKLSFFAIVSYLIVQAGSNLISVVQVFRHGQRTPIWYYENDPYADESYWPVTPGQLTTTGMQQHYTLGNFTRQRYDGWLGSYSPQTFRAQTTDVDRTHMSAQCDLAGLFPSEGDQVWNTNIAWQPIPVHISDDGVMSSSKSCPAYTEELDRILLDGDYYQEINKNYNSVYEYITLNSGSKIASVTDATLVRDGLLIESEFGYALPDWTKSVYPEPLNTLGGYAFQSYAYNKKLARLSTGIFIDTVINYFDEMKNSTSTPKYQMYSAHDTNIAQILSALGAFEPHVPYFASTIYFELRRLLGVYFINVYYKNGDTIEKIIVKGCLIFDCPLYKFKSLMEDIRLDTETREKECSETSNREISTSVQNLFIHQDSNGPGHKVGT